MADTMQPCEGAVDDPSTGSPSSVSDETDPAGVVLEARVVQACLAQDWLITLSATVRSRHGRLHQKDRLPSYPPHNQAGRPSPPSSTRCGILCRLMMPSSVTRTSSPTWTPAGWSVVTTFGWITSVMFR